jgi:Ca-activated chloride channel homolog
MQTLLPRVHQQREEEIVTVKHRLPLIACSAGLGIIAAFCVLSAFGVAALAQDDRVSIEPEQRHGVKPTGEADRIAFTVNSNLVLIPVLVTDPSDHAVIGLDRQRFHLWDDNAEQTITAFASEDLPISAAFVLDCSGSMGDKLRKSREAITQFLQSANPEDEFALVRFSDQPVLVQELTTKVEDIQNGMLFTAARGRTALLDAIVLAMDEMKHAKHSRKAILIISDGGDNASLYTLGELKRRIREADVQIYSIGITEPPWVHLRTIEELQGPALLYQISKETGGSLFQISDVQTLPAVAFKIGKALRNEYVLGYAPAAEKRDGKYHRVRVKVEPPEGSPSLHVSFRTGYVAPSN